MENIYIREAEEKDNALLAQMIRKVFDEYNAPTESTVYTDPTTDDLYTLFKTERSKLWVVEVDNVISGCCGIFPTQGLDEDCAELVKFYLAKEIRGKGIGKILLQRSIEQAKQFQYKKLYLETMPEFAEAVGMYSMYGFKSLPNPLGNSCHTSCSLWMIKEL